MNFSDYQYIPKKRKLVFYSNSYGILSYYDNIQYQEKKSF